MTMPTDETLDVEHLSYKPDPDRCWPGCPHAARSQPMYDAIGLIAAERTRQRTEEGYDAAHDAGHTDELAAAGASYALPLTERPKDFYATGVPATWPWEGRYWKPTPDDRRRELVKAGALIVAAIEALGHAD